jgi:hypothetical protein
MKITKTPVLVLTLLAVLFATQGASFAQSKEQKDKNTMRNLGIGLGALGVHKALKGDSKTGLALGLGAAYAGKKYEDQRKSQGKTTLHRSYRYKHGRKVGYWLMRGDHRVRYVSWS